MRFSGGIRFACAMAMVVALALCSAVYAADDAEIAHNNDAKHQKAVPNCPTAPSLPCRWCRPGTPGARLTATTRMSD